MAARVRADLLGTMRIPTATAFALLGLGLLGWAIAQGRRPRVSC